MIKYLILTIGVFNFLISKSQTIDTVQLNDIVVYHVSNQQFGSQLFWEVENAEIISENPTFSDSIVIECNNLEIINLSVYEQTTKGCIGETFTSEILVEEPINLDEDLYVPNIFTPNEDQKNDYFKITPKNEITMFYITIYNRWGQKIFESTDINNSWSGKINNTTFESGVYYYVIQYKTNSNSKTLKGFLELYN